MPTATSPFGYAKWGGSRSSRGVIRDLGFAQLEPDQQFEAGAGERGADVGFGERVDRGVVVASLALGGDLLANVVGQGGDRKSVV